MICDASILRFSDSHIICFVTLLNEEKERRKKPCEIIVNSIFLDRERRIVKTLPYNNLCFSPCCGTC